MWKENKKKRKESQVYCIVYNSDNNNYPIYLKVYANLVY